MQRGSRRSKARPKQQVGGQKAGKSPASKNGKKPVPSKPKGSDAAEDAAPCSRVCIKNLPEKFTNEKLRKYCESSVGRVTDVKIMHKNGVSRKFAFVGFETPESAAKAVTHLNRTFIQTSKISVEFARRIGQRPPTQGSASARPWSKHSLGSSRHRALHPEQYAEEDAADKSDGKKKKKKDKKDKKHKKGKNHGESDAGSDSASKISDKKLLEFLRVFVPKKGKSWANDDLVMNAAHEQQGREVSSSDDDSDADQMESDSDDGSGDDQGTKKNITTSSSSSASSSKVDGDTSAADVDLAETGRLFIRNLPFTITEEDLETAFSKFGHLSELHLPRDAQQRIKGFAFVAYTRPEHAVKAHGEMDGQFFRGRIMHVIPAREKVIPVDPNASRDSRDRGAGDSYKAKKAAELREAAEDKDIWSTLFIRSDTAVGVIAEQMGLGKSDILDRESSGSMAVRAALSETHVISQTKRLLEEEGVNLVALERAARGDAAAAAMPRSKRVILAKNLPFSASKEEFSALFSPFGQTLRIVFPAVRTIALVEFLNPSSAKAAFRKLAYKRFMHVPLYLEWAPLDIFGEEGDQGAVEAPASKHRAAKDGDESGAAVVDGDEGEVDAEDSSTLFVKNLNFDTTSEALEAAFKRRVSGVRSAKIVTRMDKKRGALSTGYGFVEFASPSHVMEALKKMQGMELDGHVLELKFSKGKTAGVSRKRKRPVAPATAGSETTAAAGGDDGSAGKKLLVKNLAFESSNKELRQLFGSFGQLKSVRMPRKFDGGHRGFAFVEYTTHKDARSAMAELANTHFYGRHLVVDWAKETGGVEDARLQSAKDAKSIKARRADEEAASAMAGSKDTDDFGL